jgi:hypothetical protein
LDAFLELSSSLIARVPAGATALVGTAAVFAGLWLAGRLLARQDVAAAALAGWSALYLIAIAAAVLRLPALPLTLAALPALALASLLVVRRPPRPAPQDWTWWALSTPLLALGAVIPSLYVDSYLHWLPNAFYMVETGHFPAAPLGGFPSLHPSYPPALGLITYCSSVLTGGFAEAAAPLTNVLLTLLAAASVHRLLCQSFQEPGPDIVPAPYWSAALVVAAFSIVLLLNPAVQSVHYWSALADPAIGVVVLVTMIRWCEYIAQPGESARTRNRQLLTILLLGALLSGIKHSGWQIAIVMAAAGALFGISQKLPVRLWLPPAVAASGGALASWGLWKIHLVTQLPVTDQFSVLPPGQWRYDLLGPLFTAVLADFAAFGRYYALLGVVIVAGLVSLWRRDPSASVPRLMLGFVALAMPMHFANLMLAYLGTGFADWEIAGAASLQRYSMHFGFAACATGLTVAAAWALETARPVLARPPSARPIVLGFVGVCVVYAVTVLYPTLSYARYHFKDIAPARQLAVAGLARLEPGQQVAVMGESWAVQFAKYVSWTAFSPTQRSTIAGWELSSTRERRDAARARIAEWQANPLIDGILLLDAQDLAVALGLPAAPNHKWSRASGRWTVEDFQQRPCPELQLLL